MDQVEDASRGKTQDVRSRRRKERKGMKWSGRKESRKEGEERAYLYEPLQRRDLLGLNEHSPKPKQ